MHNPIKIIERNPSDFSFGRAAASNQEKAGGVTKAPPYWMIIGSALWRRHLPLARFRAFSGRCIYRDMLTFVAAGTGLGIELYFAHFLHRFAAFYALFLVTKFHHAVGRVYDSVAKGCAMTFAVFRSLVGCFFSRFWQSRFQNGGIDAGWQESGRCPVGLMYTEKQENLNLSIFKI